MLNRRMIDDAEIYRANAKRNRESGAGTGRTIYRTTAEMDRARGGNERSPLSEFIAELRYRWADACSEARAQFQWDAYQRDAMGGSDAPF